MPNHSNSIATFKNAFDGGTRPNRFVVTGHIGNPHNQAVPPMLVKAASIPSQTLGILQVPFRGRIAKLPGDRAYAEWTFTILDEAKAGIGSIEDHPSSGGIRRAFESWHEAFNKHRNNIPENNDESILNGTNADYYTTWTINQLNMAGEEITERAIRLHYCWPVEVGAIDLSYESADTLTEYSVTLAFDYISLASNTGIQNSEYGGEIGTNAGFQIPD